MGMYAGMEDERKLTVSQFPTRKKKRIETIYPREVAMRCPKPYDPEPTRALRLAHPSSDSLGWSFSIDTCFLTPGP
jgi:hypothetical protein